MAIINKSNAVVNLTSKQKLPRDRYLVQCIKAVFGVSSGGNPMITLEWQIVAPEAVEIDGVRTIVAGQKYLMQYFPTKVKGDNGEWDAKKTAGAQGRLLELFAALGLPNDNIDDENPPVKELEGIFADAILDAEESVQRKQPTPEQKAARQLGDEILDANGKKIVSYRPIVAQILNRAEKPSAANAEM